VKALSCCLLVAGTLAFCSLGIAQGQNVKIGFVNSSKILSEYSEAQEANKKLDAMGAQWQAELERMSKDLQEKYEDYKKKESLLTEAQKKSQQEDLALQEQKGYQYRQQKFGQNGELAAATDSLLSPIKKKVMKVIEQVAKDQKLQFIFDRNDQITVLLYGDVKYDYTNLVIDWLKRRVTDK
jgi:outer membrane protein